MAIRTRLLVPSRDALTKDRPGLGPAGMLGICAAVAATVASALPLLVDWVYRDNRYLESGWRGNDIVTLALGVPLLVGATVLAARGSLRARLVWLGSLDYLLYNYLFYLFGTHLNALFLAYAVVVALSLVAIVLGIASTDVESLRGARTRGGVALVLVLTALGLSAVEVGQALGSATGGALPDVVRRTGANTHVVAALDLTLVIPFLVLGAVWIRARHPWGHVVGVVLGVKGVVYMAALIGTTLSVALAGYDDVMSEMPVWATIGLTFGVLAWRLLRDVPSGSSDAGG